MQFESAEQLANHVKRFCINSSFGPKKLDAKYESNTKNPYPDVKPSLQNKDPSQLKNYGAYTLDKVQSNLKSNDEDFKKLERALTRKREDELIEEIDKLKNDRQQMRVINDQDEMIYADLLQEMELKKEREFQCRIEKEQIRKLITEIDTWKMSVADESKKNILEKLMNDREELKIKQLQLIEDIRIFTRGHRTFHKLEETYKISDNKVVSSAQYSEHKQNLVRLHTRREYLEMERQKLLDNVERCKLGDLGQVRQSEPRSQIRVDQDDTHLKHYDDIARMKEKIAADTQRIEMLKRQQMDRVQNLRPQSHLSEKIIDDLDQLKNDYEKAGGKDPNFQQNLQNIEDFYKASKKQIDIPRQPTPQQQLQQSQNNQFQQQQQQQQFNQMQYQPPQPIQQIPIQQQAYKKPKKDFNDPFESFSRKKEFFLQNNVRGVDLTREEQILMNLQAQEVDAMRVISRIPIGTEIYRFKMEQYKELSTMRAEMEKIIQEQRLQRLRRNFEKKRRVQDKDFDNNKWQDDHRKFIIENRLRMDFGEVKAEQHLYDPTEGFVIHWDYCLGLPRRTKLVQFAYAVYNNMQSLYSPQLIPPLDCEIESEFTNRVIIGDSNQIYEIPSHPDVLLIIEIQIPISKKLEDNVGRTESFAWTQLDIFDQQRQLKRGKFKCPLYVGPTDPTITIEEIAKLEPIPNAWLHIRLTYPNDEDFDQVRSIYPEQTAMEYNIPYIHLRGLFARNYESAIKGKEAPNTNNGDVQMGGQNYKVTEEVQVFNQSRKQTPQQDKSFVLRNQNNKKKGVRVIIHSVQNHVANNLFRVMACLFQEQEIVYNDKGIPLAFSSTIHDPNSTVAGLGDENNVIPLVVGDPKMQGISNKAARTILIEFHEEYRYFFDIQNVALKSNKPIYIVFQVFESLGGTVNNSQTIGNQDALGWVMAEIVKRDGSLQIGRQTKQLYKPPVMRPPLKDDQKPTQSSVKLEFAIYDLDYNDEDIVTWINKRKF